MKKKLVLFMDIVLAIVLTCLICVMFREDDISTEQTEVAMEDESVLNYESSRSVDAKNGVSDADVGATDTGIGMADTDIGATGADIGMADADTGTIDTEIGMADTRDFTKSSTGEAADRSPFSITANDTGTAVAAQSSYGGMETKEKKLCMIGDSRFKGMHDAVGYSPNVTWIAKDGVGHGWYWDNREEIKLLDRSTAIVYELGINSLNPSDAIEALLDIRSMGFSDIYVLTLAGVDEQKERSHGYSVTTEQIEEYNYYLKNHLPYGVKCIDAYSLLYDRFYTVDGIHYDDDTYAMWYDMLIEEVNSFK